MATTSKTMDIQTQTQAAFPPITQSNPTSFVHIQVAFNKSLITATATTSPNSMVLPTQVLIQATSTTQTSQEILLSRQAFPTQTHQVLETSNNQLICMVPIHQVTWAAS